jgi:hypothetical protein
MSDDELHRLVRRHGATGKLVRAICAASGWRWTPQGAPPEWYVAYRGQLGSKLEKILQEP